MTYEINNILELFRLITARLFSCPGLGSSLSEKEKKKRTSSMSVISNMESKWNKWSQKCCQIRMFLFLTDGRHLVVQLGVQPVRLILGLPPFLLSPAPHLRKILINSVAVKLTMSVLQIKQRCEIHTLNYDNALGLL